jgi:hypothetical protein
MIKTAREIITSLELRNLVCGLGFASSVVIARVRLGMLTGRVTGRDGVRWNQPQLACLDDGGAAV